MKTVLLYACAFLFISCQKEIILPSISEKEPPQELIQQPEPEPEPPGDEISESVYLRNLPVILNAEKHYKLTARYTYKIDLWSSVPEWVKDDVHTFIESGEGKIESTEESCPSDPFTLKESKWIAYADDEGVKLDWMDIDYSPVTYLLLSAEEGKSFKAYYIRDGVKIYSVFTSVE